MSTIAAISLGSNLGDRRARLDGAVAFLRSDPEIEIVSVSRYLETAPVGGPSGQGAFLNAAATLRTTLGPDVLHSRLREAERRGGRIRAVRWDARTLDLDLLMYGLVVRDGPELRIPHPRLAFRRFVLGPLAEIAPTLIEPTTSRTVGDLLANLDRRPSRLTLVGEPKRTQPIRDRLAPTIGGDWIVTESQDFASATEVQEEPTFLIDVDVPDIGRDRIRAPVPILRLESTDLVGQANEIVAACVASRVG